MRVSKTADLFHIIPFPQKISEIISDKEIAFKYLVRSRAHFMIYGSLVQRNVSNSKNYILKLHGIVRHKPIDLDSSSKFTKEFTEVLPKKIIFPEAEEVLGFELTPQYISYVIRYVIGIAAYVSNDFDLSYNLFNELNNELQKIHNVRGIPVIAEIEKRLPLRFTEVLTALSIRNYAFFIKTRDKKYINNNKPFLDKLIIIDPNNYFAHLSRSIYYFVNNKIDDAIKEFNGVDNQDVIWRYNLGFLLAYKNDISGALEQYRKAFYKEVASNIINDTEVFISEVIKDKPELIQLYFFRGLINYKAKFDYRLAKEDFEYFLNKEESKKYTILVSLANKYLLNIKKYLGI